MRKLAIVLIVGCLATVFCQSDSVFAETVAERFDKAMKKKAEYCETHKIDPANRRCDILKLKPADPLATEEGRFAHNIKIPNPVSANSGYKPGMTSEQYFEHLCKTEAGEFIYKTVENVEGLFLMRPRQAVNDDKLQHLYALEDPYAYSDLETDTPQKLFINPPWWRYKFFEVRKREPTSDERSESTYLRYSGYIQDKSPMHVEEVSSLNSMHGYIWRGIKRPHDRELGIVGGELIVIDLHSNKVLAVRRGFIRSGDVQNNSTGVWWLGGHVCPKYKHANEYTYEFISKVLKPTSEVIQGGSDVTK
jgi:hypothetical protein